MAIRLQSRGTSPARQPPTARVRRFLFRKRRLLAALLLCAAAGIAVEQMIPADRELVSVVVASRDLAAGTVLDSAQLDVSEVPAEMVPPDVFHDPSALSGRQLAGPLHQGSVLADTSLVGPGLLTGSPPGTVAVPIRPTDSSILELLSVGQLVDVVHSTGNGYEIDAANTVLATGVAVLWTSGGGDAGTWPGAGDDGGLVVVAADPKESAALAGAASSGQVHLILTAGR